MRWVVRSSGMTALPADCRGFMPGMRDGGNGTPRAPVLPRRQRDRAPAREGQASRRRASIRIGSGRSSDRLQIRRGTLAILTALDVEADLLAFVQRAQA